MKNTIKVGSTLRFTNTGVHVKVTEIVMTLDEVFSPDLLVDIHGEVVFKETPTHAPVKLHDKLTWESDLIRHYLKEGLMEVL